MKLKYLCVLFLLISDSFGYVPDLQTPLEIIRDCEKVPDVTFRVLDRKYVTTSYGDLPWIPFFVDSRLWNIKMYGNNVTTYLDQNRPGNINDLISGHFFEKLFPSYTEHFNTLDFGIEYHPDPAQAMLARQINEIVRIFKNTFIEIQRVNNIVMTREYVKLKFPVNMQGCVTVCGRLENLLCIDLKEI